MASCRGVVIGSNTNRARTQMAEGILRYLTRGRLHVTSGGVHHGTTLLPQAVTCMEEWGVSISNQSPSTLGHVWEKIKTFDAFVSIDEDVCEKVSPEQAHFGVGRTPDNLCGPSPTVPAHWSVGADSADVRETWTLWSPRVPSIAHENSCRKFQDHLYEGEPLFRSLSYGADRHGVRLQRRWVVPSLSHVRAMERGEAFLARVRAVRGQILTESVQLLRDLEEHYGEAIMDEELLKCLQTKGDRSL